MNAHLITYDAIASQLSWPDAIHALKAGHMLPKASMQDVVLGPPTGTLVSRAAWIEGLGYGVKSFTVVDSNAERGIPTVQGAMFVFDPHNGSLEAVIDSRLVTEFKTAADSVLGASYLARPDSKHLLIVGAGDVARSLIRAYPALFPQLERVSIWARRHSQSSALGPGIRSRSVGRGRCARPRGSRFLRRHHRHRNAGARTRVKGRMGDARYPRRPDRRIQARHARSRRCVDIRW